MQRLIAACFALFAVACGSDGAVPQGNKPMESGENPLSGFTCPGGTIRPGVNTDFPVGDTERTLIAEFPADTSKPMAVIFSWHGFTDTAEHQHDMFGLDPDWDPDVPAIVITPDDIGKLPPEGLDWQIGVPASEPDVDVAFFEAMLGCLNEQQKVDPTRIYSHGFSAGSVMTSLIYSTHPKLLAAAITESGAWFNDPAEAAIVNWPEPLEWNWPALDPADGGHVLLTHGGPTDVTVLDVLSLENAAQAAFPFLKKNRRTVIDCPHDAGHSPHPELTAAHRLSYLFAHRLGEPSPFSERLPDGFPPSCIVRAP